MPKKEKDTPFITRTKKTDKKEEVKEEVKKETKAKEEKKVVKEASEEKPKAEKEKKKTISKGLKETIIPADLPEEEIKDTKKEEKPKKAAAKKETKSKDDSGIVANKKIVNKELYGELSDDVKYALKKNENTEQEIFEIMKQHQKNNTLLWGIVAGVGLDTENEKVMIKVLYNGMTVLIPDIAYFEPTWKFSEDYNSRNSEGKLDARLKSARETIGANCPFICKAVSKSTISEGAYAGEEEMFAIGSRSEALAKLRDKYFLHKETDEPVEVSINDQAKANVVYVGEDFITVECFGVETRIDAYNLNGGYVNNCKDYQHVGDVKDVRVKKIRIEGDKVYLGVTGRLNLGNKAVSSMKKEESYIGVVESFNKAKEIYTVKLKIGVNVSVHANGVHGHVDLNVGDVVSVTLKEVKDTYTIGVAMKI